MINIGLIIAAGVLVIYLVLGPIVIMGIYSFLDRMAEKAGEQEKTDSTPRGKKDPALWTSRDVRRYMLKHRRFRSGDGDYRL